MVALIIMEKKGKAPSARRVYVPGWIPWYLILGLALEHALLSLLPSLAPPRGTLVQPPPPSALEVARPLGMIVGGYCLGKEGSKTECGEDAWMVRRGKGVVSMAVADGVGGWAVHGGDSSAVSKGLLQEWGREEKEKDHANLTASVERALQRLSQRGLKMGATTLTAAQVDLETGLLQTLNIGDSELIVVREGRTVFRTEIGLFGFNAPLQVGFDETGRSIATIRDSQRLASFTLQVGDLVLAASDGLFDNLFPDELDRLLPAMAWQVTQMQVRPQGGKLKLTNATRSKLEERLQSIAKALCHYAHARSHELKWPSPFTEAAVEARKAGPDYLGGKHDDVSVIIALMV